MEEELAINLGATTLHTDSWKGYVQMADTLKGHEVVNHNAGEYVCGGVTSNMVEGLLPAQTLHRQHPPPRQQGTPTALPGALRLHVLHPRTDQLRADAQAAGPGRRPPLMYKPMVAEAAF